MNVWHWHIAQDLYQESLVIVKLCYNIFSMPGGEREPRSQNEQGPDPEKQPEPYYLAARFGREHIAGLAYSQAQQTIFGQDCDLSVYRFQLNRVWHVAVLGEEPPTNLQSVLQRILSLGDPTTLPTEALRLLIQRRTDATRQGPWVE